MTDIEQGAPYIEVEPKRSFDKVPLQVDWHDYLVNLWRPGVAYSLGARTRPRRARATGKQYRITTAGVSGHKEPRWTNGMDTVTDGTAVWTPEAIDSNSLRSTISSDDWPDVTGLTLSDESNGDLVYEIFADGGTSGQTYEVKHQVTLANGEEKEAVIILPVSD